jgi:hypothetical protein
MQKHFELSRERALTSSGIVEFVQGICHKAFQNIGIYDMQGFKLTFIDNGILNRIFSIMKLTVNDREPKLQEVKSYIKKLNNQFFSKLVDGLWEYYSADKQVKIFRATKTLDTTFDEENDVRNEAIDGFKTATINLEEAKKYLTSQIINEYEKKKISQIIDDHFYRSQVHMIRQELILFMNNLSYDDALKLSNMGLNLASSRYDQLSKAPASVQENSKQDINFFAGHKREIDAYKILNKPFWDITNKDFFEAASLFESAIGCLKLAAATKKGEPSELAMAELTAVPLALMHLLRFMARPSLSNIEEFAEYKKTEETYFPDTALLSGVESEAVSKRKLRLARLLKYFKNNTIKIASWEIYGELHYNVNLIEIFVNDKKIKPLLLSKFRKKVFPDSSNQKEFIYRVTKYENLDNLVTFDRFVDDVEGYFPELLPAKVGHETNSLTIAKDLYHFMKHEDIRQNLYSVEREKFAEDFINRVLEKYSELKTLTMDAKRFKDKIDLWTNELT